MVVVSVALGVASMLMLTIKTQEACHQKEINSV
jgi:hypothetical protein